MEILGIKLSQPQAAKAAGVKPKTIQNWISRDLLIGHSGSVEGGGVKGLRRSFTFHSVMQIAIANALIEADMGAKIAVVAAGKFAHEDGGGEGTGLPYRLPSLPFHQKHGKTVFAVGCGSTHADLWKADQKYDTYSQIRFGLRCSNFTTIDAYQVFRDVCAQIGVKPDEALNAAYPQDAS